VKRYEEWEKAVADAVRRESLWEFVVYRKALFFYDVCWVDCEKLVKHLLGRPVAQQLIRSAGSISANIEEGWGRGFGKDRDRFLRIALASARESKGWYYRARALLAGDVLAHRLELASQVIALLLTEINKHRRKRAAICDLLFAL
jgi:four helix bundle protein